MSYLNIDSAEILVVDKEQILEAVISDNNITNITDISDVSETTILNVEESNSIQLSAQPGNTLVKLDDGYYVDTPQVSNIGGFPVEVSDTTNGDVIIFKDSKWVNNNKVTLTDGGNF